MEVKKKRWRQLMVGHVSILVRGDPKLKQRLDDLFSRYQEIPRAAMSQMICELVLFIEEETRNGAEIVLRKEGKERKIVFPPKWSLSFTE
jgi:hypothetical protein